MQLGGTIIQQELRPRNGGDGEKGKITAADMKAALTKCHDHAKAIGPKAAEMKHRVVTLRFLNSVLNIRVVDLNQEALFRCTAVVKDSAWGCSSGLPPPLLREVADGEIRAPQ